MSKITNDGLTQSGTGCFIAVPMATVGVKGLDLESTFVVIVIVEGSDQSHPPVSL